MNTSGFRVVKILIFFFCFNIAGKSSADSFTWNKFRYPITRYSQQDALDIADRILTTQKASGGWGKMLSPDKALSTVDLAKDKVYELSFDRPDATSYSHKGSTLDNWATHSQIRYLLRVAKATNEEKYKLAALRGINYLLAAQTTTGGWPQNFPNTSSYGGQVTFNDDAMVLAMTALKEASSGDYDFIDSVTRNKIELAFLRGVDFILQAQIVINGVKTAWCAQHDRNDFSPVGGRSYELPSISGAESVGIIRLLMSIEQPNEAVKRAIVAAVEWLERVKLTGVELVKVNAKQYETSITLNIKEDPAATSSAKRVFPGRGYDNKLMPKPNAKPIWARFYDLETQQPFFVGWDGVKRSSIDEIDIERRTGYMWYGYWPENLLNYEWPKWKKKNL